ncbi:hypothetical protein BTVI_120801 [Pitangus sulphuratus]|nr:hypothetical protein BTVI_120801 [Pitangus sulphuratus]
MPKPYLGARAGQERAAAGPERGGGCRGGDGPEEDEDEEEEEGKGNNSRGQHFHQPKTLMLEDTQKLNLQLLAGGFILF